MEIRWKFLSLNSQNKPLTLTPVGLACVMHPQAGHTGALATLSHRPALGIQSHQNNLEGGITVL